MKLNIVLGGVAGALAGLCLALGYYIESLTLVIVMLNCCAAPFFWKRAFQVGWLKGRQAMLNSMAEATRRQMGLIDWVEAEMERDGFVVLRERPDD
jgi:hypothetical protein